LLAQEPWARAALQRHGGKVAAIDSGAVALRLQVTPDGYRSRRQRARKRA
jgi:ubiquinone biosynthesis protein UbiJ